MATVQDMYNNWCLEELRGWNQVNKDVWLAWFNKWLLIFQKMIMEYVSGKLNTSSIVRDIEENVSEYSLPLGETWVPDFYSIIQLRVAYKTGRNGTPLYRICKPISLTDYNIRPASNIYDDETGNLIAQWGRQRWEPWTWWRISMLRPRYVFTDKDHIKIFPTPVEDVENWLMLNYNFIVNSITAEQAFDDDAIDLGTLNLPWYFFDAIEDYITFRLYQAENPEMAQWYYQQFESTLHDNIYWLNRDKRPIDEWFANTTYFSHY